jgi:ribosomal protein L37AE/L43A
MNKTKMNKTKKKFDCKNLQHDFKHLKRYGRADWRCPKCGENVMLLLVYAYEAGIDLTK